MATVGVASRKQYTSNAHATCPVCVCVCVWVGVGVWVGACVV